MNLTFGGLRGGGGALTRFQKFGKATYRIVVPSRTESFGSSIRKCIKTGNWILGDRRQTTFIFGYFPVKSKFHKQSFCHMVLFQYVRAWLLKQWKYSKEICMGGNNVKMMKKTAYSLVGYISLLRKLAFFW